MAPIDRRLIKRYAQGKLYDTRRSQYVTLSDLAQWVATGENVVVIDNRTRVDVTQETLLQAAEPGVARSPERAARRLQRLLEDGQKRRRQTQAEEEGAGEGGKRGLTLSTLEARVTDLESRLRALEEKKGR